jgi:hypothetical protein
VPADELAGGHSALEDFWGRDAAALREGLFEADVPEKQLEILESFLAARLPRFHGLNPAVAHALERFTITTDVAQVVRETGYRFSCEALLKLRNQSRQGSRLFIRGKVTAG